METGYFHQMLVCASTGFSIASCLFIMNFSVFGVPSLKKDPNLDISSDQAVLVGSIVPFMGILGNIVAGISVDKIGRKYAMAVGICLHILGCVFVATAASAFQILVGRAASGVALSLVQIPSMIYGSEVIHPSVRDRLNSIIGFLATLGSMIPFMVGEALEWRALCWLGAALIMPSVIILGFLPQSPVYLVKTGKMLEAKSSLKWLRSSDDEAVKELKNIIESIKESEKSSADPKIMFKFPYLTPLLTSILLLTAQQITGITVLMTNIASIVQSFGMEWNSWMSIAMVIINIGANFVSAEINLRYDRKPTLLRSSILCIFIHLSIGVSLFFNADNHANILGVILLFLYFAIFGVGFGPIPFIYIGEGMPTKIRGPASALCFTINTLIIGLSLQAYKPFVESFGLHNLFFFCAGGSAILVSIIIPLMLETRGKSVSEIDDHYSKLGRKKQQ